MTFIWATRGRDWGFRFLRTGGFEDPLPVYKKAFVGAGNETEAWQRLNDATTPTVAVRFPDPEGRQDRAGRVIPHDFVVFGDLASKIDSVVDGVSRLWPEVADQFAGVWDRPAPLPDST